MTHEPAVVQEFDESQFQALTSSCTSRDSVTAALAPTSIVDPSPGVEVDEYGIPSEEPPSTEEDDAE